MSRGKLIFITGGARSGKSSFAEKMANGFGGSIAYLATAQPLDEEMILRFARPGGTIITAEEAVLAGGFGSAVREVLDRERKFDILFKRIGLPLEIYPLGSVDQIKNIYKLDSKGLVEQIREFYASST